MAKSKTIKEYARELHDLIRQIQDAGYDVSIEENKFDLNDCEPYLLMRDASLFVVLFPALAVNAGTCYSKSKKD